MIAKGHMFLSIVVVGCLLLTGCSPRALREAQRVVAQADSLRSEGVPYTDSVTMAGAYNTLEKWQYIYPTDYARACYYYGRLLRNNDDPVAAMQVFINATHTNTRDYHILARTYSNMGSICQLANEHMLSYDMYSYSADLFLQNGDTILYYYALNDMAIEQAVQGKKEETLFLINLIQQQCPDSDVLLRTFETKAEMYRIVEMYDSAVYWINEANNYGDIGSYGTIIKAQSFDNLEVKDSALFYARCVLAMPFAPVEAKYNMLYITSHYDTTLMSEDILYQTSQRADIGIMIDNQHARHAQASEILYQDLHKKPYQKSIIVFCILTVLGVIIILGIVVFYTHKKKALQRETKMAQQKQQQLLRQRGLLLEEQGLLTKQNLQLKVQRSQQYAFRKQQVQANCQILQHSDNMLKAIQWKDFDNLCEATNHLFFLFANKLKALNILSEKEIRLCILVLIGSLSDKEMADILYYSHKTIRSTKRNVALKMGTTSANFRSYLIEMAIK